LEENDQAQKDAINDHKVLRGIEAQTYVFNKGIDYWLQLQDWNNKTRRLSTTASGILNWIVSGKTPTEKQSVVLIQAEKDAKIEGFYPTM